MPNTSAPSEPFTFVAVGSAMFQRRLSTEQSPGFHELLSVVRSADAAFLNLEAPIFEPTAYPVKQYVYSSYVTAEPWLAEELRWAGFNLVCLANNHMTDWSPEAARTNHRLLEGAGLIPTGVGETLAQARAPGYLDTAHGRVALISVDSSYEYGEFKQVQMASDPHGEVRGRPGVNGLRWENSYELDEARFEQLHEIYRALLLDREGLEIAHCSSGDTEHAFTFRGIRMRRGEAPRVHTACHPGDLGQILRWVRTARSQADYVIVSHHTHSAKGRDWELPADYAREFAYAVIDAGADAFIGHGFTPKGIEVRRGRPIFYDVGRFCHQDASARRHPGDAYDVWGLDPEATPGEFADAREAGWARARTEQDELVEDFARSETYGSVVRLEFSRDTLTRAELYPNMPSRDAPRHRREIPGRVHGAQAEECLERFRRASEPYGTELLIEDGIGKIQLPAEHA